MKKLKNHRISAAHPTINTAMVELALENSTLPENETKPFNELFTSHVQDSQAQSPGKCRTSVLCTRKSMVHPATVNAIEEPVATTRD